MISRRTHQQETALLIRFMYVSVAAAVLTIILKSAAAAITGSVGFLSDALESTVNLVAAVVAIFALRVAARPADSSHHFGHGKSEYVSALVEGMMIFIAAAAIILTSVQRLMDPQPLESVGIGLVLTTAASVLNGLVGVFLLRQGRRYRSATLSADGRHLITDVWTSVGVLVGIAAVWLTGWHWLDPAIALAVGANILVTGYGLLRDSLSSLISQSLSAADHDIIDAVLGQFRGRYPVDFAPPRTVSLGRQRLVNLVMGTPPAWSVEQAHNVATELETALEAALPGTDTIVHIEPWERMQAPT
ncbi:cation diffusion facilitator family transporter [Corynebacterium comes]|uniref:Ferrous-iron efflux pump FieF n=1 Tax=Corynebacterium comes TaxID=2675218 RepID=A0A6B8VR79_9CORY|nr:cation diffusion facilitator family transporter [Corynebacterium comes]QGU05569.1 Ferrous-iron efflux pump FieF [Corynebacterium comes]